MISVAINVGAVLAGGLLGLLCGRGFPERISDTVMKGLALCVLYIGISGAFVGEHIMVTILAMAAGGALGELLDLDGRLNRLGQSLERRFGGRPGQKSLAEGFVTASMLFCVGAMAIVGSLQSGLVGDHSTIIAKSLIDGIAALVLASTLGLGVLFSGLAVLVYQGSIVLGARVLEPLLDTVTVNEMSCVGSLLIVGLAFNMLGLTNLKVTNYIPAIFLPMLFCCFV